jgi:hypothetical protein
MSLYVKDIYGTTDQQLSGALIPNSTNMYSGNLIQPLPGALTGGRGTRRGGNLMAAIPPVTLLAMQQLYGRKSRAKRGVRRRSRRFRGKRSRRYRAR